MCDPVTIALITAVGTAAGAGASIINGQAQAKKMDAANKQAAASAATLATQQDQSNNRLNAKSPNVAALQGANAAAGGGGVSSTMLTGPSGVDPSTLALGKKTLLGA